MKFGRVLLIGFVLMLSSELTVAQSRIEAPDHRPPERADISPVMVDIPAQSLETALKALADATHIALFYESSVVVGRRSFALRGEFSADVALRLMLQGTGLSSASFERGTITILPSAGYPEASELRRAKAGIAEFSHYLALVQKSLDLAFCRAPVAASDPDELLARLWLASSGEVSRADLLSSTGSDQRDRVYAAMLGALAIEARPPVAMPQPINLMIMPKKSRGSAICVTLGTEVRSATHE